MKQELFNKSLEHIRRQGRPSLNSCGFCVYRSDDGCGCAAAPFIIDYLPEMEGSNFSALVRNYRQMLDPDAVKHVDFVCMLQAAHDRTSRSDAQSFMRSYEKNMQRIADIVGLEYSEP